jgi:hypothetical protein
MASVAEIGLEIEDVLEVGAAPLVIDWSGSPTDGQFAVKLGQPFDEQVLRPVGVLIIVDHDVLELARVALARLADVRRARRS